MFFIALVFVIFIEFLGVCVLLAFVINNAHRITEIEWRESRWGFLRGAIPARQEEEWPDVIEING